MYYTNYLKKEIFTDRQTAIASSRIQAKDEFFDSLVDSTDYKEIKVLFNAYMKDRCIIYEVKIQEEDLPI